MRKFELPDTFYKIYRKNDLTVLFTFQTPGHIWEQMARAFQIWKGSGMSLQGVRTCGDYMFSGHTVVVTMLNFLITECKLI